jgi:hypothetical protein
MKKKSQDSEAFFPNKIIKITPKEQAGAIHQLINGKYEDL